MKRAAPAVRARCCAVAGCPGNDLRGRTHGIRDVIRQARDNGAYQCAPRELAMAESHVDFADAELDDGNYFPAKRRGRDRRGERAPRARALPPKERCNPPPPPKPLDTDGDGIPDKIDKCPTEPEDKDGFQDEDGCPDPDNDNDGILDKDDKCPNEPEDKDGFEDEDGCPDPDNDKDGILDVDDKCPNEPGPKENGGCPDNDRDGDGVVDRLDKCPDVPGPGRQRRLPEARSSSSSPRRRSSSSRRSTSRPTRAAIYPDSFAMLDRGRRGAKDAAGDQGAHRRAHRLARHAQAQHEAVAGARRVGEAVPRRAGRRRPTRMEARGFGPTQPIDDNRTAQGRETQPAHRVHHHVAVAAEGHHCIACVVRQRFAPCSWLRRCATLACARRRSRRRAPRTSTSRSQQHEQERDGGLRLARVRVGAAHAAGRDADAAGQRSRRDAAGGQDLRQPRHRLHQRLQGSQPRAAAVRQRAQDQSATTSSTRRWPRPSSTRRSRRRQAGGPQDRAGEAASPGRRSRSARSRPSRRQAVEPPPAPAEEVQGLVHTPVDESRPNAPIPVRAKLGSDVGATRVFLFFRGSGQEDFLSVPMKNTAGVEWVGVIPGEAVDRQVAAVLPRGARRARPRAWSTRARRRARTSSSSARPRRRRRTCPRSTSRIRSCASGWPRSARGGGAQLDARPPVHLRHAGVRLRRRAGRQPHRGRLAVPDCRAPTPCTSSSSRSAPRGMAVAPFHLAVELGVLITPKLAISVVGRFQMVTGANAADGASPGSSRAPPPRRSARWRCWCARATASSRGASTPTCTSTSAAARSATCSTSRRRSRTMHPLVDKFTADHVATPATSTGKLPMLPAAGLPEPQELHRHHLARLPVPRWRRRHLVRLRLALRLHPRREPARRHRHRRSAVGVQHRRAGGARRALPVVGRSGRSSTAPAPVRGTSAAWLGAAGRGAAFGCVGDRQRVALTQVLAPATP